jgi:hypothetical protein
LEKNSLFLTKKMGNIGSFGFTSIISTNFADLWGAGTPKISVHHKIGKNEHCCSQFKQCRPTNILHDLMYKRTGDSGPG